MNQPEEITEDTLLPILRTQWVGRKVLAFGACDSTFAVARRLLEGGSVLPHGTLVVADYQRGGYGRRGRQWHAPAGAALLFSVVFRQDGGEGADAGNRATMAAAVAVVHTLRQEGLTGCSIKWPNDVLAPDGRKLCGILTEQVTCKGNRKPHPAAPVDEDALWGRLPACTPPGLRTRHRDGEGSPRALGCLIVGVGINVNQTESDFAEDLRGSATSVRLALGRPTSRLSLLARVLEELEKRCEQPRDALAGAWREASGTLGRTVRVRLAHRTVVGEALALENDGSLVLRLPSGVHEMVYSGDVEELRLEADSG